MEQNEMRWSTFREESPSLRQLLRRWKSEEIEERKWKAKWLESGLISMQNARLVLRVHAWSLVPPPPSFISNRQPCWIRAPNPFRILPSPSPSSLSLPYVSRLFYALVARWKRLRSYLYHSFPVYTLFSSYFLYKIYIKKKPRATFRVLEIKKERKEAKERKKENTFTGRTFHALSPVIVRAYYDPLLFTFHLSVSGESRRTIPLLFLSPLPPLCNTTIPATRSAGKASLMS